MYMAMVSERARYFICALPVLCEDAFYVKIHNIHLPLLLKYLLVIVSLFVFFYCACGGGNVARMGLL